VTKLTFREINYEPMEPGSYEAIFMRYEGDEMEHGPVFKLFFEITNDHEYEGKELSRLVSQKFNPQSHLFQTVQGLLGRPIRPNEEIDLDDLVGRPCVLNVGHNVKERGTFEYIEGVNPAQRKKQREKLDSELKEEDTGLDDALF
jgi:hypothetical protein